MTEKLTEVRVGRNFIRLGDRVRVKSLKKGGRTYESRVREIREHGESHVVQVRDPRNGGTYLIPMARVERMRQTKAGESL